MRITNCIWEIKNLGKKTIEIQIEKDDLFSEDCFLENENGFEYSVVKVPINKLDFNYGLSKIGYSIAEMQMSMIIRLKDFPFDHKLIKWIYPYVELKVAESVEEINDTISKIQPGMFSTDRISLDPFFGMEIGCRRYINWVHDELEKGMSKLLLIYYKGVKMGFVLFKEAESVRGLLGGIYPEYQDLGVGVLTPTALPLYLYKSGSKIKKVIGDISSNNKPVWELYESFNYKVYNPQYIFIKHII